MHHFPCLPAQYLAILYVFCPRPEHLPCLLKTWTFPMSAKDLDISHVCSRPGHFPCLLQTWTFPMSAKDLDICHVCSRPGHLPCLLKTWTFAMSAKDLDISHVCPRPEHLPCLLLPNIASFPLYWGKTSLKASAANPYCVLYTTQQ